MKLAILQTLLLLAPFALAAPRPSFHADSLDQISVTASNGTNDHGVGTPWTVIVDDEDPRSLHQLMAAMAVRPEDITHTYDNDAFKGFSGIMTEAHAQKMSNMTGVKLCEPVKEMGVQETIQTNAPWGLQRISQAASIQSAPVDSASVAAFDFSYRFKGVLGANSTGQGLGKGVDIYVIDTGVFTGHIDFDGRATSLETGIVGAGFDTLLDQQGHGYGSHTHYRLPLLTH
jgi:cerevisin